MLRVLFGVLRWIVVLGLVASPLSLIRTPTLGEGAWRIDAPLQLQPTSAEITRNAGAGRSGLQVRKLSAELELDDADAAGPELVRVVRWTNFLEPFFGGLLVLAITEFLWRLFRNLERGQFFTDENIRLMRWIGLAWLVEATLSGGLQTWQAWRVAELVPAHISLGHLRWPATSELSAAFPRFCETLVRHAKVDLDDLILGLLLLALAEVFRQGLALKRENDLTV